MGDRLRLRAPDGDGANGAAQFARLFGFAARLVRTAAAPRQTMDEVLAQRAWCADSPYCSGVPDLAPLRSTVRDAAAAVVVVADSVTEGGALKSSTCVWVVCSTFACAGAA